MLIGSHLSIAGGLENALLSAEEYGFEALAMFVRNQRQWQAPELTDEQVKTFRDTRGPAGVKVIVAHGSYLVNLAGDDDVREKSIAAVAEDLRRCDRLGIEYLVIHPGSHADADEGLARIAAGCDDALADAPSGPMLLLETVAGQGKALGRTFAELATIRRKANRRQRIGICLDTAHVFAAGYDLRTAKTYRAMMDELDDEIGMKWLRAVHVNDSLKSLGSRVDRHAHLGEGEIGRAGFKPLARDKRLAEIPLILETPKETRESDGRDWDEINAETLRDLAGG